MSMYVLVSTDEHVRCSQHSLLYASECTTEYTVLENTYSIGGVAQKVSTLQACRFLCDQNVYCLGFDYNTTAGANLHCYLHYQTNEFAEKRSQDGVNQYIDESPRNCPDGRSLVTIGALCGQGPTEW